MHAETERRQVCLIVGVQHRNANMGYARRMLKQCTPDKASADLELINGNGAAVVSVNGLEQLAQATDLF